MNKVVVKPKKKNKILILSVFIFLIIAGSIGYYFFFMPEEKEEITYQTGKVKQGDLTVSIENSGVIQYIEENEISSAVNGTISEMYISENSLVKAGDPLLKFDDQDLQFEIEQTYSDLKIAQLKLADLLQTTVDQINQVSIDQLTTIKAPISGNVYYSIDEGSIVDTKDSIINMTDDSKISFLIGLPSNEIERVKAGQSATIRLDDFSGDLDGTVEKINPTSHSDGYTIVHDVWISVVNPGMLGKGMTGAAEIETASGVIIRDGEFEEVAAEVNLYPLINGTVEKIFTDNGDFVKKGTVLAKIDNTSILNQIETQKLEIDRIRIKITQLEQEREDFTIYTAYSGKINDLYVKPGDVISSNTKIAKILSNELVAKIEIDELDIGKIGLGQESLLFIPAVSDEEITGKVAYISDVGIVKDGITTYEVHIQLPAEEKIKAGMTVDASILLAKAENIFMVPSTSVIDVKDGKAVRVLVGDQIEVKKVETGISNDTMTEIISGIELTDVIITSITIPTSTATGGTGGSSSLIPSNVSIPGVTGGPGGGGGGTGGK